MSHDHQGHAPKSRWVFWGFVAIATFFLLTEHTAHVLGALPYLFLALCPLMHLFMHHGHHHGGGASPPTDPRAPDAGNRTEEDPK